MSAVANPLLRHDAKAAWAPIEAEQRRVLARPHETVEQRLARGQRLSAQAARLRRSVLGERSTAARP